MPDPLEFEKQTLDMDALVALLPPKVRAGAHGILSEGGDRRVQLLTRVISKERAKRGIRAKMTALPGCLLLIGSAVAAARPGHFGGYILALGLSGFVLLAFSALAWLPTRLEKTALQALLRSDETQGIGPALEGLRLRAPALRAQAHANLIELLPQTTPEAYKRLTPTQRGYLFGALSYAQRHTDMDLRLSVLAALQEAGDKSCLGVVYQLAIGEAETDTAGIVREAARHCFEHLFARLDFGPLESLPPHIVSVGVQIRAEKADLQVYAESLLTLRRLLPLLTPSNYESVLSGSHRDQLYRLLMLYAVTGSGQYRYGRRELHLEILRTAERVGDVRALDALHSYSCSSMAASDEEIYVAAGQTVSALERLAERA